MKKQTAVSLLKKIVRFAIGMILLSLTVFFMARLAPGDPLRAYYGESAERMSIAQRTEALERLGLDQSLLTQYGSWAKNALHGDFGISLKYKQDVMTVIGSVWKNTLILGTLTYLLTFGLALLLGIFCAANEDRLIDRMIRGIGTVINCIPPFWTSLLLLLIFSVNLRWLPSSGAYEIGQAGDFIGRVRHLILPLTVLVLSHLWYYAYMVRNKLLDEVRKDYVLSCRARGLSRRKILFTECLPNILPAYFGIMAVSVPHILGGTYIVEKVFSYPGLGTLCFESAKYHDYNLLMALSLITGALVLVTGSAAQALGDRLNPRIRCERRDFN